MVSVGFFVDGVLENGRCHLKGEPPLFFPHTPSTRKWRYAANAWHDEETIKIYLTGLLGP